MMLKWARISPSLAKRQGLLTETLPFSPSFPNYFRLTSGLNLSRLTLES